MKTIKMIPTPGPWHIMDLNDGRYRNLYVMAKGKAIVKMEPWNEMDADAHLICAAPDLLAALKLFAMEQCVCAHLLKHGHRCRSCKARAAITKAKGE